MSPSTQPPTVPASFGRKGVHFAVGLAALAMLGSIGLVVLGWRAGKLVDVTSPSAIPAGQRADQADSPSQPGLSPRHATLLAQAEANPDYRAWVDVEALTRDLPSEVDDLDALRRRLAPIETRWSSLGQMDAMARALTSARRTGPASDRRAALGRAQEAVASLRSDLHARIVGTILTRDLPALAVSRDHLIAFADREALKESWVENGLVESAEWRTWTFAGSSRARGESHFANAPYVKATCDGKDFVVSCSLHFDAPDESGYVQQLLALPKSEQSSRHALRAKQVLSALPPLVDRFLRHAAPDLADAAARAVPELAARETADFMRGVKADLSLWEEQVASTDRTRVKVCVFAGVGVYVLVEQPEASDRLAEIAGLLKVLGGE